jgi:hypothetical protein
MTNHDAKKAAARLGKAEGEVVVFGKIAAMPAPYSAMGERLHALILRSAPALQPTLGVRDAGVCKGRQGRLLLSRGQEIHDFGFTQDANLTTEEGAPHQLIECAWYFTALDDASEAKLSGIALKVAS